MSDAVLGWLVNKVGELEYKELRTSEHEEIFIEYVGFGLFGQTTVKTHLLNKDFFLDKTVALRKGIENARGEMGRIAQQIEDYHLKIKELEDAVRG